MKQIRFKHLATLGVCCSLFSNSLAGVTAVAETMTIESSPTAASHEQTASTKESAETEVKETQATETSEAPTKESQEEQENGAAEVKKEEQSKEEAVANGKKEVEETQASETAPVLPQPMPLSGIGTRMGTIPEFSEQISAMISTFQRSGTNRTEEVVYPAMRLGVNFISEDNSKLNMTDFGLKAAADTINTRRTATTSPLYTYFESSVEVPIVKTDTGIDMEIPSKTLSVKNISSGYSIYWHQFYLQPVMLTVPKYINSVEYEELLVMNTKTMPGVTSGEITASISQQNSQTYVLGTSPLVSIFNNSSLKGAYLYSTRVTRDGSLTSMTSTTVPKDINLKVTHKKVTESFKSPTGATIPPPPNFEEGRKTSITNNDFTYTQSGTLPKSYKGADGRTYFLKGWYKGKTKPNTLETGTPSYKVTYDDNDDLTVVYEEPVTRVVTVPAVTYQFGFVTEKGTYVYDAKVTGNATEVANDEKTTVAPLTSKANGIYQEIAVPTRRLSYHDQLSSFYGVTDFNLKIPKYYKTPTVKPGSYFTGPAGGYPTATVTSRNLITNGVLSSATTGADFALIPKTALGAGNYTMATTTATNDATKTPFARALSQAQATSTATTYKTTSEPILYFLENRRINARYVDQDGNKLTSLPPDVKQDTKTPITSENFTFMHGTTLPDSYKGTDGKTYKFKGWYRGKSKPNTLQTTKQPSYQATFGDNDDLTVVYDSREMVDFPALTYQFGFVDEAGKPVDATKVGLTYDNWAGETLTDATGWKTVSLEKGQVAPTKNNLKEIAYPSHSAERISGRASQFSAANLTFTLPRYYEKMSVYNKNDTFDTAYPLPNVQGNLSTIITEGSTKNVSRFFELTESDAQSFVFKTTTPAAPTDVKVPTYLRKSVVNPVVSPTKIVYYTIDKPIYYYLTNRKVTENFIDPAGNKLTSAPTGFKQGQQTAITTDPYTYTSAKALPDSYKGTDGKTYIFKGWYRGKTKPNTLKTTKTPSYPVTFDGNDDLNVVYEEGVASVEASLKGVATIMPSGGSQLWNMIIKNTGTAPLTGLKVTPTANWSSGLATPIQLSVKVGTGGFKNIPVTKETWKQGIALDTEIPVGQSAMIQISTVGTGAPLEVLQAELNVTSNAPTATVSSTVRIQGTDQEVTDPVGEGFISLPTFDFGQVGIAGTTTQHGLKKAADYYGNGTRNPFVRIKKSQPNWSLTAQLSQPKSAKDSLPTATRLLLGQAAVSKVDNYNLVTEMLNPVGMTSALSLTANNAVTNVITDKQFTGNDVYHLDFNFNNVKLEVPANQGTKGEQYNATVTWNLVTGP